MAEQDSGHTDLTHAPSSGSTPTLSANQRSTTARSANQHSTAAQQSANQQSSHPGPTGHAHLLKYVITGDSSVGKSALLHRYVNNQFSEEYLLTIGVDFAAKTFLWPNGDEVKLQIWDTAGQERYRSLTANYFRGSLGAIVVYDVTRRETADHVTQWVDEVERYASNDVVIVVVGTKSDLKDKAEDYVRTDDVKNYDSLKDKVEGFFEVSGKTGEGVEGVFQRVTDVVVARKLEKESSVKGATVKLRKKDGDGCTATKKCC
ncbi:hypothetical protein BaRGS_00013588 [Batillaria attramentaria]|uniref:Uncharacterized protein n=1 Tax=Batillaria attramentaria TaxID=370345 RepID=A0ABD0L7A1_9CAEN